MRHNLRSFAPSIAIALVATVSIAGCSGNGGGETSRAGGSPPAAGTGPNDSSGDAEQVQRIEETIRNVVEAFNTANVEEFLGFWTANGIESEFGVTAEQIRASPDQFFKGPPDGIQLGEFRETGVEGETAASEFEFVFGQSISLQRYTLISENGEWKIDETAQMEADIPSDVTIVEVSMVEFAFEVDQADLGDGNVGFRFSNDGEQQHEAILLSVPEGYAAEQLLSELGADVPDGVAILGGVGPFDPGVEGSLVLESPLSEGSYMLVCFLPDEADPEGTPHASRGMLSSFQLPAAE